MCSFYSHVTAFYRSNQFITEVQIYKYLSLHPCHTDDPLEADAFIVPAQTVSAIWLAREKGPNGEAPLKDEGASYMKEGEEKRQVAPDSVKFPVKGTKESRDI